MKKLLAMSLVTLLVAAVVQVAAGAQNTSPAPTYTGCVNDNSGKIKSLAEGSVPLEACAAGHTQVTLGAGDITAVVAGTGLTGGAVDGEATLSLGAGYQLPQGCSDGQIAAWDDNGAWSCASSAADTDEFGKYTFFVGIGQLTSAGPNVCADHGSFTNTHDQLVNQPPLTIPAGRYLVVADDVRWDIVQNSDVNDPDVFPYGFVDMTLFDHDSNQVATRWRRTVDLNTWGGDNFEPGTFVSDGGQYYMRYLVNAGGCTTAHLEGGFSFIRVG